MGGLFQGFAIVWIGRSLLLEGPQQRRLKLLIREAYKSSLPSDVAVLQGNGALRLEQGAEGVKAQ